LYQQGERPRNSAKSRALARGALVLALAACDPTIHLGAEAVDEAGASDARSSFDGSSEDASLLVDGTGPVDGSASVIWSSSFENGTFSEWDGDGQGKEFFSANTSLSVSTEQAHSGTQSAKLTIDPNNGIVEDIYLFRGIAGAPAANAEAYYGAWFFIPQRYVEPFYWNIFHFLDGASVDRDSLGSIWDVDLRSSTDTGELVPYVYDYLGRLQRTEDTPRAVPIGKWFHLEVLVRLAADDTGRFAIWQDGVLVFDVENVMTSMTPWIQWAVGSTSTDLMPSPADLYIDDVTLSSSRVGP
jgi:hypothetical protein